MVKHFQNKFSALLVAAFISGCAGSPVRTAPVVPNALRVTDAEVLALSAKASGVQVYVCRPAKDHPGQYDWGFKAPEADLFDRHDRLIGHHYAGPTWELNDGSKVVGEPKARDAGPDASAVPWLLLSAKSALGPGVLGAVKSIQRVDTVGGLAPAQRCSAAQAGTEVRVAYHATYHFYTATQ